MTDSRSLITESYSEQLQRWPSQGRHILAHFDETTIVVYQAYATTIATFAVQHGFFGGDFSLARMSWIKPNFLWMMYRSGWATKPGQTHVLALWLRRTAFDAILEHAVLTHYDAACYPSTNAWQAARQQSEVLVQWDPDHHPSGARVERRAIQLGLRGATLAQYATKWIEHIEDVTSFVHEQRHYVLSKTYNQLLLPREDVYPIASLARATYLGIHDFGDDTPS